KEAAIYSARSFATKAFIQAASDAIQLHGGIGFTEEIDCHLFLKRAKFYEHYLGFEIDFNEHIATAPVWQRIFLEIIIHMTKTERQYYSNIINGEQMTPETNKWMDSIDPATGKAWAKIPLSTESDADKACKAANGAFPEWSKLSARMRGNYLRQVGDALTEHIDELLELETKNNGWVLDESRYGGIVLQDLWYDAAGAAPVIGSRGQTTQMGWNHFGYTTRVP